MFQIRSQLKIGTFPYICVGGTNIDLFQTIFVTADFRTSEKLEVVLEDAPSDREDDADKYSDKQTNTECAFHPDHAKQLRLNGAADRGAIQRSQTFSPTVQKHYVCKLNRSDSDSAMPLYRRGDPFRRNAVERRSLRLRRRCAAPQPRAPVTARTSLDLELDLRAQHARLDVLGLELSRLRRLKERLERAKEQGDAELASWLLEDRQFQNLMAQAESCRVQKTAEERKVEKMLRKVSKEIYKLRKSKAGKGNPDLISFK